MDRIQLRRDSSARWAEINPILLEGEVGYEIDTKLRKIGDGVNRWNDLEYLKAEGISQETGNSQNITMSQDAITRELSELGSEVEKINNTISMQTIEPNQNFAYAPFRIVKGSKYDVLIKRLNDVDGTVQMRTSATKQTSGHIDTLENLPYGKKEASFSFIASEDANYIACYAALSGIEVSLTLDVTGIINEANSNKNEIKAESERAKSVEATINNSIKDINNNSNKYQLRNAISNLTTPNNIISAINWFFCDSMIVKNSKITIASFAPLTIGESIIGLWKYENAKLTLMEKITIEANVAGENIVIQELQNRTLDYDCFVSFTNTDNVTGCVGINTNIGNRLFVPKNGADEIGSVVDFTSTATSKGALCVRLTYNMPINNYPTDTTNLGILEVGPTKKYKTIQEAVNVANNGNTILVYPGVYDEQVQATSKTVHIVGIDKYSCILRDRSSNYYTPPLEIYTGSVCNMTIKETADVPTEGVENIEIPNTGLNAKNMAYCIHADWDYNIVSGNAKELVIDNCIMTNKNRPCIGAGLRENYWLKVRNCRMESGLSDEGKGRGAFYCHAAPDGQSSQYLELYNNVVDCFDGIAMTLRGYEGGTMNIIAYNNIINSEISGRDNSIVDENFGNGLVLLRRSFGNNVQILNGEN